MTRSITLDATRCLRCGACQLDCPTGAVRGKALEVPSIDHELCIDCGHCGAVCKSGAIGSLHGEFAAWEPPGIEAPVAKAFLAGRRSTRRYRPRPVERALIEDVLSIGAATASASNARDVRARVFTGGAVHELATHTNDFYLRLARLLERRWLRPLLWFTAARPYLQHPRKLQQVRDRARAFDRDHDWIFFGAPAVVLLSAPRRHATFGRSNCVIAADRMMQYAAALGLGSCMIGYAEVAVRRRPAIARAIGLEGDQEAHALFTLGYAAVEYRRLPARPAIPVAWRE
jgi:ferredoxin